VLQLRVYGGSSALADVAEHLQALPGTRHVSLIDSARGGNALVTADVRPDAADQALTTLRTLGVAAEDVALLRLDTIGPVTSDNEPTALVWADVLSQARLQSRVRARYLLLMAVAGVIAGAAVINDSATLLVGAMAISPDLYPLIATCTGLVLRRPRLVRRGAGTLLLGLAIAGVLALATTLVLKAFDALPTGFRLDEYSATQTHVSLTTVLVALAAGAAGMLAVETRASAAVGVAISVTTIPASAYLGDRPRRAVVLALRARRARDKHRDDAHRRRKCAGCPTPTRFIRGARRQRPVTGSSSVRAPLLVRSRLDLAQSTAVAR